jgi:hypothetical protein
LYTTLMKNITILTLMTIFLVCVGACQPTVANSVAPTFAPFPTMTPGQALVGALPTGVIRETTNLTNPATAIAFANRPTPTPNFTACPVLDGNAQLARKPTNPDEATQGVLGYLQDGGGISDLREALRVRWEALGENSFVRDDVDLTGEGENEIVIGYTPNKAGMLLIIGCSDGQYVVRYSFLTGTQDAPRLNYLGDINNAVPAEFIFANRVCVDADNCDFDTQVLAWDRLNGRFNNLLDSTLITRQPIELTDIDNDIVGELVVNLRSRGTSVTGPLRTGVNIWDWNGTSYTLSIIQLDPPRYVVQVVQEGDKLFSQLRMAEAVQTYSSILDDTELRLWFNDEEPLLKSYALYRMALGLAYLSDARLVDLATRLNTDFPITAETSIEALPVYALLAYRFLDSLQVNPDLHSACVDVLALLAERPDALNLLNRYGSRSPVYSALDLCPF